jgi:fatty acid desaturase
MTAPEDLDHKALIASLPAAQDAPGLLRLAAHLGALAATGAYIALGLPLWPAVLVPHGALLVFLFTAEHEAIHRTAFRTNALNVAVAHLTGFLLFLPPAYFRYFHLAHHRFTHDPANDPELATPKARTPAEYAAYISGLPEWASRLRTLARNAARETDAPFVPARGRARVRAEARAFLLAYAALAAASLAAGTGALLWLWLLPALLGGPFLRAYLLAEHARCPHVANMLENTRTTFTNRLVRFFAWNMPYHAEHHAYPAAPFHQLPALHRLIRDHLRTTERGYLRFNGKYLASLKTDP